MPSEWKPPERDAQSEHDPEAFPIGDADRGITEDESEALDHALLALAQDCQDAEPAAWLEASILKAARQQGLLIPEPGPSASAPMPDMASSRWIWRPAILTVATVSVVMALLWMPAWRALRSGPEKPAPGLAALAPVPPEAYQRRVALEDTDNRALAAVARPDGAIARPDGARKQRAVQSPPEAVAVAVPAALGNGTDLETGGAASPSMEWPAEVLAAARQMTQRSTFDTLPAGFAPEQTLQSVRVRMGANDLWRMGLSSAPTPSNQAVLADFLVGEDGRPLAVRLVGVYP